MWIVKLFSGIWAFVMNLKTFKIVKAIIISVIFLNLEFLIAKFSNQFQLTRFHKTVNQNLYDMKILPVLETWKKKNSMTFDLKNKMYKLEIKTELHWWAWKSIDTYTWKKKWNKNFLIIFWRKDPFSCYIKMWISTNQTHFFFIFPQEKV